MDLKRCYALLELSEQDGPDELKSSYRRLAFACHPDLHPEDPDASGKFQELNEAYVTLLEHLESRASAGAAGSQTDARGWRTSDGGRPRTAGFRTGSGGRARTSARSERRSHPGGQERSQGRRYRQEEILKNILKDPFARQVFEEIFRTVKRTKPEDQSRIGRRRSRRSLSLAWGSRTMELDLSRLKPRGVKKWLRSQLDHEQTLYLPPTRLLPGTTLSIAVRHGFRDETINVNTTIPPDYTAGRPLRLKGLGRRLGPWKGDLYLRLLTKSS